MNVARDTGRDQQEERVRYLDGWRGFAVLAVLFGHYFTSHGINSARLGVELFFVLSGRLMAEILFVRNRPLGGFYVRRFARVYPALFFFAASMLAIALVFQKQDPQPLQWLSVVTLTYNYAWEWIGRTSLLGHIWSLCVEEHMYLLLGLVAFLCRRFPGLNPITILTLLIVTAVAVGAVQTVSGMHYYEVYWRSDVRGASILMGSLAYLALRDHVPSWLSGVHVPLLLGLAGLFLNLNPIPDPVKYSLGTACLAISLCLIPRAPAWILRIFENRIVVLVGLVSYSLYLWQQPFFKLGYGFPWRLAFLPLAILAALASYRIIEKPARALLNRAFHARQSRIAG